VHSRKEAGEAEIVNFQIFVFGSVLEHHSLNLAVVGLEAANQAGEITQELEELTGCEVILLNLANVYPHITSFRFRVTSVCLFLI